ncbi:hypothetical protein ACFXHA_29015 [Nocardia sp. NPDC059240]|uniref:hypothetical protein n=1 Tax=Nocardia sp. NPDC059240 TaxID=3346786 RepID=UPI0036AFBD8D
MAKPLPAVVSKPIGIQKRIYGFQDRDEALMNPGGSGIMDGFTFHVDMEAADFFWAVVVEMVNNYRIDEKEAIARINERFLGLKFVGDSPIYHETEGYWAKDVYYGHDVWWKREKYPTPLPPPGRGRQWLHRRHWWQHWHSWRRRIQAARLRRTAN